jgi:CMP-N-acetylneuraminic acid synthetase
MMSIGIFIPARTRSRRLPNKLLLPFGEYSLFEIACQKISSLPERYGKYVLICEDPLIEIAERYHNIKILYRDPETIELDDPIIKTMGGVKDAEETHLMFLNPCLAFLSPQTILKSLRQFETMKWDYATSSKEFRNWVFSWQGTPINHIDYSSLNTKAIVGLYQMAHCFHIFNKDQFLKDGLMLHPGHGLIHVPEEETIDVDTMEEYLYAKWKWESLRS